MGNNSIVLRGKRWTKFLVNMINEKLHGLDFSMVYVGDLQRNTLDYHGYNMTDAGDMERMLKAVPIDVKKSAFLDVGCGKGMVMKCAKESGYGKVSGLDLDKHLLDIARNNMEKLKLDVDCIYANAAEFKKYADFDVFYFYNPFGESILKQVIEKIKESQTIRNRDIYILYYHPVYNEILLDAGFVLENELQDRTRDYRTEYFFYSKQNR